MLLMTEQLFDTSSAIFLVMPSHHLIQNVALDEDAYDGLLNGAIRRALSSFHQTPLHYLMKLKRINEFAWINVDRFWVCGYGEQLNDNIYTHQWVGEFTSQRHFEICKVLNPVYTSYLILGEFVPLNYQPYVLIIFKPPKNFTY